MSDILGILLIGFMAISALSILSIVLMFVLKNEKAQKVAFYLTALSAIVIAVNFAGMTPLYMVGDYMMAAAVGVLAIAGILVERLSNDENRAKRFLTAKVMVTVSALASMIMMAFM